MRHSLLRIYQEIHVLWNNCLTKRWHLEKFTSVSSFKDKIYLQYRPWWRDVVLN
jgi:hypothetical protein